MNKDDLIKKLENLDFPEVKFQSHQRRLKTALLNSGYWKEKKIMFVFKKFVLTGVIAVVALFAAIGVKNFKIASLPVKQSGLYSLNEEPLRDPSLLNRILDGISPRKAWAKDIIEKSAETVRVADTLPSLAVTKRINGATETSITVSSDDYLNFLKEAEQAKDLSYIGDKVLPDGKKIKVLLYTLGYSETNISSQYAVLLGIDENDIPVVRIVYDTKIAGGVIFEKWPSSGKSVEEMMNYWTESLENQPQEQQGQIDFKAIQK